MMKITKKILVLLLAGIIATTLLISINPIANASGDPGYHAFIHAAGNSGQFGADGSGTVHAGGNRYDISTQGASGGKAIARINGKRVSSEQAAKSLAAAKGSGSGNGKVTHYTGHYSSSNGGTNNSNLKQAKDNTSKNLLNQVKRSNKSRKPSTEKIHKGTASSPAKYRQRSVMLNGLHISIVLFGIIVISYIIIRTHINKKRNYKHLRS